MLNHLYPFWKTWTTYEEPRKEQECMSIQKELYRSLVIAFKGKKGLPFPDTSNLVCPFCEQEFKFSRNLRQHCRKEHEDSLLGSTHFTVFQENDTQQEFVNLQQESLVNLNQESTVQQEFMNLQQESAVKQEFVNIQQEDVVQQMFVNMCKEFSCEHCDKVYLTKDTLKRHKKEKHAKHSINDFQCVFCHKSTFKNPRCRKWHQKSCPENPNKQIFACLLCNKEYQTKLNLKFHINNKHP